MVGSSNSIVFETTSYVLFQFSHNPPPAGAKQLLFRRCCWRGRQQRPKKSLLLARTPTTAKKFAVVGEDANNGQKICYPFGRCWRPCQQRPKISVFSYSGYLFDETIGAVRLCRHGVKMKGAEVALGQKTQARRRVGVAGRREYHAGGKVWRSAWHYRGETGRPGGAERLILGSYLNTNKQIRGNS